MFTVLSKFNQRESTNSHIVNTTVEGINSCLIRYVTDLPLREQYEYLHDHLSYDKHTMLNSLNIFNPISPKHAAACLINHNVRKIVHWVNENIVLNLYKDDFVTTSVKLRIATGMLNKLSDKDLSISLHDMLVLGIKREQRRIINQELPFIDPFDDLPF